MAKKTFYIIISLIIAGIFVTFGIFLVQKNATNRVLDATLIVKSRQPGFEFWELLEKGAKEGAKEFGVNLTVDGAMSEEDTEGQVEAVRKAIASAPDMIILAAADRDALLPYAKEIREKGITLIIVDSGLSENVENCFVGTDNYEAAKRVGDAMGKAMDGKGRVAVISHSPQATTAQQRTAGFMRGIQNYPDMEIMGTYDIGDSTDRSYETTSEILRENPDITGLFATNQISAEGVSRAIKESGRDDIYFYAFDSSTVQNEALENGIVDGFAVQMPFNMGYMAVQAAVEAYDGTLRTTNIDTGFAFATKENMCEEEIQKLIYPFV
ncbi:substrate-binding domain-containing protein [Christensenella intestinihominis]|uniref:substrate-binding domain-containing protein n=1 Tax=Christensenella intestinihominis TaxID=1851429 RepID=UPI0008340FF9|nr:substrate-binding domain-containing protein [Christensenella intestinihominis]